MAPHYPKEDPPLKPKVSVPWFFHSVNLPNFIQNRFVPVSLFYLVASSCFPLTNPFFYLMDFMFATAHISGSYLLAKPVLIIQSFFFGQNNPIFFFFSVK